MGREKGFVKVPPVSTPSTQALILFAHGARDPAWGEALHELARLVTARDPTVLVQVAYLELQAPTLATAIDELAVTCTHITVLPVFWAAAGHVRQALPTLLTEARARHPQLTLQALPPLSELPGLLAFVADAALAAVHTNNFSK